MNLYPELIFGSPRAGLMFTSEEVCLEVERTTPFTRMLAVGNRLIEAQQIEDKAGERYANGRTSERLKEWQTARRLVQTLAVEYSAAIREWRASIEV